MDNSDRALRVLVLGGTAEARALAEALRDAGIDVISSLAGRVREPRLPVGAVRVGGFGGPDQLAEWLAVERIGAVVDATHPFAQRISESAATATTKAGVPLLMLRRPGWTAVDGDDWRWVDDLPSAARTLPLTGERAFLTTGRQGLGEFAHLDRTWFLVRCVDQPEPPMPARTTLLLDRGPYTVDGELALMTQHRIDVLVTKDSGGDLTSAKLEAARRREIPVIVVRRPPIPDVPTVAAVADVLAWLDQIR